MAGIGFDSPFCFARAEWRLGVVFLD